MAKPNHDRMRHVWLFVLILFVCVAATTIAFTDRLSGYLVSDEGAISLITGEIVQPGGGDAPEASQEEPDGESRGEAEEEEASGDASSEESEAQGTEQQKKPGFQTSDNATVWTTDTKIEIFRMTYENGEQNITVQGLDGDNLIAPGTKSSYTFKLKNTGNVPIDYNVEMDAYFTPADIHIPVTGRLNRYDGEWLAGGADDFAAVPLLDAAEDDATLGAGKYTYYTLEWYWPYESGDDEHDTFLGDLAVGQDLVFTIAIKTWATESEDPDNDSGISPPQTGDSANLALWIALAVASFVIILLLFVWQKKEREESSAEAETVGNKEQKEI